MKRGSKLFAFLRKPRGWFLAVVYPLTAAAIVGSVLLVTFAEEQSALAYLAYAVFALAAIGLAYSVYTLVVFAPALKRNAVAALKRHAFTAKLLEHYDFKTAVFSSLSLLISVAFAVMNLVSAIRYRSVWYAAFAAYYAALIAFRGGVLLLNGRSRKRFADDERAYEQDKWRIHLGSGAFLLFVELAMAAAVTQMMLSDRPTQSGMVMAISNAAYTFFKMAMAIVNLVKARRHDNPVTRSLRNLNFADACMSVASLTVLMISTFDEDASQDMVTVKALVGFAACAAIIVLASVMIARASKHLKTLKEEKTDVGE